MNSIDYRKLLTGLLLTIAVYTPFINAKVIEYEFDIDYKTVNFTGNDITAMSIGGSIPAPTIEATVGDTLRVTFHNKMDVPSSVHWHGILLPQEQDGVPFVTMKPIQPGASFTYEYPVIHHGTYWYHSHTGLQEQRGIYGSMVFHPKGGEAEKSDHDLVVVLSDWTDENPNRVMHNLKKSDDYYALKKDTVQSWQQVIAHGREAIRNRINGAWIRMGPMDISDIGYDAFLLNGEKQQHFEHFKPGETIRLRIINAAASSYFFFEFSGGDMTLVAADGVDVVPVKVDSQRIAIAETFDVLVTLPDSGKYEFRATSEDGTGYASLFLGRGPLVAANDRPKPNPYLVDHSLHGNHGDHKMSQPEETAHHSDHRNHMNHQNHHHHKKANVARTMTEYELLESPNPTRFNPDNPTREVLLKLTGDMERFAWSFNEKVLSEDSQILIKKGETVQFILDNRTMMHHPIHLHGHFFRVLNGKGEYSPLKHTVNVPPMETVTIEFYANEEKDWLFHCHNLYHMKSGMTRVVSYQDTTKVSPESLKPIFADLHWYYFADLGVQSNFSHALLRADNTRNTFELEVEQGMRDKYNDDYEIELVYERYINRFFEVYIGGEAEREVENGEEEKHELIIAGFHYLLPLLIDADVRLDSDGNALLELSSELQLTDRLAFEWEIDTDEDHRLQLEYELNKQFVITGGKDSHYKWGVGMEFRY